MFDGPYPPRVVPNMPDSGATANVSTNNADDYPSVQRVGTQWSRIATPPPAPPSPGLQLSSPTPCGIPWNRLYGSSSALKSRGGREEEKKMKQTPDGRVTQQDSRQGVSSAPPAASTLLYRPSPFAAAYLSPSSTLAARAPATARANSTTKSHEYHDDESIPVSPPRGSTETPTSVLTSSTALSRRYQQLAAEHRYGSAFPAPSANTNPTATATSHISHTRTRTDHSDVTPDAYVTGGSAFRESGTNGWHHDDFLDRTTDAQQQHQKKSLGSARDSAQNRQQSPFSKHHSSDDDGGMHGDSYSINSAENKINDDRAGAMQTTRSQRVQQSGRDSKAVASKQERTSAAIPTKGAFNAAALREEETWQRYSSRHSSRSNDHHSRTNSSGDVSRSSRPRSRENRTHHTPSPQQVSGRLRAAPHRTRSAGPPAGGASLHAAPRTAQWVVKLIDELVAQVALQQASSTTGPVVVSANLATRRSGARRGGSRNGGSSGRLSEAANGVKDAAVTTVADLTTSFLLSRYGALQWRPMLKEFAVCLHRYHHLSPACAVFREYFIHVDADTLSDFHLFCRLYDAADIPHCSTVEVRRVMVNTNKSNSTNNSSGRAHTIVARRYIEVREVADRLQRMLQRVVLIDTTPCVVVGEGLADDHVHLRGRPCSQGSYSKNNTSRLSSGGVRYRYGRGPPVRTSTAPWRRRLTVDEIHAVKKVVVSWLEDSIEAEREAMTSEGKAEEVNVDADGQNGAGSDDDVATGAPSELRHITFDRPGLVDAYALLQATLEAVKLLCCTSRQPQPQLQHSWSDMSDVDEYQHVGSNFDFGNYDRAVRRRTDEQHHREGQKQHRPLTSPRRQQHQQALQQPLWQAAAASNPNSPLVRRILAAPPSGYAYPVDHRSPSSPLTPSTSQRSQQRQQLSSPDRHRQAAAVHRVSSQPPTNNGIDYYDNVRCDFEDNDESEKDDSYVAGLKTRENANHRQYHHNRRSSPNGFDEPSYRRPRHAAAATAAAIAEHRAHDGRLWSPPREGVVGHRGEARQTSPRRDRRRSSPGSGGSGAAPSPRLCSSSRELEREQQRQQESKQHLQSRGGSRLHRSHDSYDEAQNGIDDTVDQYTDENDAGVSPRHWPSSQGDRLTPKGRPPRSTTSSPSNFRDPAWHEHVRQQQWRSRTPPSADSPHVPHAYVADLHAKRRWQQVQRQVSAEERRDACWRQHPRMQARLQQQQQVLARNVSLSDHRAWAASPGAAHVVSPHADTSAVDATINDIDRELMRRERSRERLQRGEQWFPSYKLDTHEVMHLCDSQEAAAFASHQVRLVPPPGLPEATPGEAHPIRIRPKHAGSLYDAAASQTPFAATGNRAEVLNGSNGRIRIEQITPPAPTTASSIVSPQGGLQPITQGTSTAATASPKSVGAATTGVVPALLPSAGLRFTKDAMLSKDTVFLTDEEQAMLDQLEVALHRLDTLHRRDHAATSGDGVGSG